VLIVTPLFPPAVGGAATYFADLVERLAGSHAITVLTERTPGAPRESDLGAVRVLRRLPRHAGAGPALAARAVGYARSQLWLALRLGPLVRRHGIDLIHFHGRLGGRAFHAALRRSGVPIVADLRDRLRDPAPLARVADRVLCCGEAVRDFALAAGIDAARLVPIANPLPPVVRPAPEEADAVCRRHGLGEEPYVLFVGDVRASKGVYALLDAFRCWRGGAPPARLVVVGRKLEGARLAARLREAAGVRALGALPRAEVLALMSRARIVALPSLSEGLPTVILEALALGVPVIAPPGVPEFERDLAAFVVPRVEPQAIAERLEALWSSPPRSRYPLARHDPARAAEAVERVYRELVARDAAP
jgi:glycosyltransferase involved in cell wall biosynthesis